MFSTNASTTFGRLFVLASLVLVPSVSFADVLACQHVSKCKSLWVPAEDGFSEKQYFQSEGHDIDAKTITKSSLVSPNRDINARNEAGGFEHVAAILPQHSQIRVAAVSALHVAGHPDQIWLQVADPNDDASPSTPPAGTPPTPAAPAGKIGSCFTPSKASPTSRLPIIDPPVTSVPPSTSDIDRLLFGRDIICDQNGLIVHQKDDGSYDHGDTAQREGWYWVGVYIREHTAGLKPWPLKRMLTFDDVLKLLQPDGALIRRAPDYDPTDDEYGASRDQMVAMVAAMGLYGKRKEIQALWDALPEDFLGKHAANGHYNNFLNQHSENCQDIKKIECSPTADCSANKDERKCDLQVDARDCSLLEDKRDCSQPHDERDCSTCLIPNIFTGGCSQRGNNPICEGEKAAQNKIYDGNKIICEGAKTAQNALYATQKATCEGQKTAQNTGYAVAQADCLAQQAAQNGLYDAGKGLCEIAKTAGKPACEIKKQVLFQTCKYTNRYTGDLVDPAAVNLFREALGADIDSPTSILPDVFYSPMAGDTELLANQPLQGMDVDASVDFNGRPAVNAKMTFNPDKVGDDLNNIILLLMAQMRHNTDIIKIAVSDYKNRPLSYGSYMKAYYEHFGQDMSDIKSKMATGITSGWKPDANGPLGAARWYHRPSEGANPQLATLYAPIIEMFLSNR